MFSHAKRMLCAGLFVVGTTAAVTVSGAATASAVPAGTINLKTSWDVYQRPSGSNDSPAGFHVTIDQSRSTATKFEGDAHALNVDGDVVNGTINGRTITFQIQWYDQKIGTYQGTWFDDGYLRGNTRQEDSSKTAEWWSRYSNWTLTS